MEGSATPNLTRRKRLGFLVAFGFLVVLVAIILALTSTLKPNAKARANVRTLPINEVSIGALKIFHESDFALIVVRRSELEFFILDASYNGNSADPIYTIFPGRLECKEFSISTFSFVCSGFYTPSLEWNFDGKPTGSLPYWIPNLKPLPYVVTGGLVRYGKGA